MKVHEARVSHHSVVGVEEEERDDVDHQTDKQPEDCLTEVFDESFDSVLDVEDKESRDEDDCAVYGEDAEVWKCPVGEVPVAQLFDHVHSIIRFFTLVGFVRFYVLFFTVMAKQKCQYGSGLKYNYSVIKGAF